MKSLRSMLMLLLSMTTVLMMVQTAAAVPGKGGGGSGAALIIDSIRLDDPLPQGGPMEAHISGGGFLGGTMPVEVTMDGGPALQIVGTVDAEMLAVTLPATTEGDHVILVSTGNSNKESDSATIHLGGEMIVSCISWFVSGPQKEHAHTEVHIEDTEGNAVVGATVVWEAENPSGVVYQTNTSPTFDNDGHAKELLTCSDGVLDSGTTGWFCCIGAGEFDQDGPPGKRACDPGTYTATIISVITPLFRNMVWDPTNEDNVLAEPFFLDIEEPQFP